MEQTKPVWGIMAAAILAVAGAGVVGGYLKARAPALPQVATRPPVVLDQGWSPELREAFYFTPQGSRLLPLAFLKAVEQPEGEGLFLDPQYIARFGFLPADGPSPLNPDGLPIGFAADPRRDGPFGADFGLTCAACHTGEIRAGSARIRIDGGAALADYQTFMTRLTTAFARTLVDPTRFARFSERVGGDPATVRTELQATVSRLQKLETAAKTAVPYGRGRLDAFGHILNAVAADALGEPANLGSPDAPVSYPFLWTTPAQRFVQWNGVAGNPIGRNLGEVLGVFGRTDLAGGRPDAFASAALIENLRLLEDWAAILKPPPWPERQLGAVDRAKAAEGEVLFKANCAGCHGGPDYRLTDAAETEGGRQWLAVTMVPQSVVGTDPRMLDNFRSRIARSGPLAPLFGGAPQVPAGGILLATVSNVVENDLRARNITGDARKAYSGWRFAPGAQKPLAGWSGTPAYKAGPLAGVWATGPFLHNGSVPTVYDLLSPQEERPARFHVGSSRYDAAKLGFISDPAALPEAERDALTVFDTTLPGNSNAGHAFPGPGAQALSPDQRRAVIEYLKILEGPDVRVR